MSNDYIKVAKQKLNIHKSKGAKTNLSVIQAAELLDVINGKIDILTHNHFIQLNKINLN